MNIPIDPRRLPTLTEEVALEPNAAPLSVPVLRQPLHGEAFADTLPMVRGQMPPLRIPKPAPSPAALIASIASSPIFPISPPVAVLADPRPLPAGPVAMLPPWVHRVVAEAIDEAIAQAMPNLLNEVSNHVRKRLTEAAQNPNRNLF